MKGSTTTPRHSDRSILDRILELASSKGFEALSNHPDGSMDLEACIGNPDIRGSPSADREASPVQR